MVGRALFSSNIAEWETPAALFKVLDDEFQFTLDAAATEKNRKCKQFLADAFAEPVAGWGVKSKGGNIYLNPPYGRNAVDWVARAYEESRDGPVVVMLLPARTDTRWFHQWGVQGNVRLLPGRLRFEIGGNTSLQAAPFPSMLIIFDRKTKPSIEAWNWRRGE